MKIKTSLFCLLILFFAFVLEHLPLPEVISWFQPAWVMLAVMTLVFFNPAIFGLWLAIPVGLLSDIEHSTLLGLNVIVLTVYIALIQMLYRRLYMYSVLQQAGILFLFIVITELVQYWTTSLIQESGQQTSIWLPALLSALMWPWVYVVGYRTLLMLQRN